MKSKKPRKKQQFKKIKIKLYIYIYILVKLLKWRKLDLIKDKGLKN